MLNERRLSEMRSGSRLEGCFDAIVPRQASSAMLERDRMVGQARSSTALRRAAGVLDRAAAQLRAHMRPTHARRSPRWVLGAVR